MTSGVACRVGRIVGAEAAEAAGQETASDSETGSRHSAGPPARAPAPVFVIASIPSWWLGFAALSLSLSLSLFSDLGLSHIHTLTTKCQRDFFAAVRPTDCH